MSLTSRTDVLVVGAGPAGSAAASWAAQLGMDVLLTDAAVFPRDKTCGDGLTPRAVAELDRLGLGDWLRSHTVNRGLRATGFGQQHLLPWPGGSLPDFGSAVPRTELDDKIRRVALDSGASELQNARAIDADRDSSGRVRSVTFQVGPDRTPHTIECERLIVADGVRSPLGKVLGRIWHRDTVYAVAGRSYVTSERSDDAWISSHLELRGSDGEMLPGYGWIFPLGNGEINLGVGALATSKRPASIQLRPLMEFYRSQRQEDWNLGDTLRMPTSALLPMGGAVSGVSGPNWMLIGDAAACVNPLNGEGIDYGLETGRFAAELLADGHNPETLWPALLSDHYAEAFSIARRLAGLLTIPRFLPAAGPIGMRSFALMTIALKVMGNLITEADRDAVARLWRAAGRLSIRFDDRAPFTN